MRSSPSFLVTTSPSEPSSSPNGAENNAQSSELNPFSPFDGAMSCLMGSSQPFVPFSAGVMLFSPVDGAEYHFVSTHDPMSEPFSAGTYTNPIVRAVTHFVGIAVSLTLLIVCTATFVTKGGDKRVRKCAFCGDTNKEPHSSFCSSFCSLEEARRLYSRSHEWTFKVKPHEPFAPLTKSRGLKFIRALSQHLRLDEEPDAKDSIVEGNDHDYRTPNDRMHYLYKKTYLNTTRTRI